MLPSDETTTPTTVAIEAPPKYLYTGERLNTGVRLPADMIAELDRIAPLRRERTRAALVETAVANMLEWMRDQYPPTPR